MKFLDAHWLTSACAQTIDFVGVLDATTEDVEGALRSGDFGTAIASARLTLIYANVASLLLIGIPEPRNEMEALLALARFRPHVLNELSDFPSPFQATPTDAQRAMELAEHSLAALRRDIPFPVANVRSQTTFMETMRLRAQIRELERKIARGDEEASQDRFTFG